MLDPLDHTETPEHLAADPIVTPLLKQVMALADVRVPDFIVVDKCNVSLSVKSEPAPAVVSLGDDRLSLPCSQYAERALHRHIANVRLSSNPSVRTCQATTCRP